MRTQLAVAHIADSRSDFYARRQELVAEELEALDWLRREFQPLESGILQTSQGVADFATQCQRADAQSLIIHLSRIVAMSFCEPRS